jgi:3-dehydroquinate synthetase
MAELVKTRLLAGRRLDIRGAAAYKVAICLRDPYERGERSVLNLGHTFAHALEAAAGYEGVTHGQAVALGLLAALRLSGADTTPVDEVLRPRRARVDRERAWAALRRDKKARDGRLRLVLLDGDEARWAVELPETEVRAALEALIAK